MPAERKITLAVAGEVRTYNVVDPAAARGERTRVIGAIYAPRRQPTPDEIKKINESLAAMERGMGPPAAAASASAPPDAAKPKGGGASDE